jgi:hypothetical protein
MHKLETSIKNRPNLLESCSPIAVFSPVQSSEHSNTQTELSKVSSISSTLSIRSEVDKCKEVIFRALTLKKNVSRLGL